MQKAIFHDPSGRRARRTNLAYGLLLSALVLLLAGFAATLALSPKLPAISFKSERTLAALHPEFPKRREVPWIKALHHLPFARVPKLATRPLTLAFYVSWDERARSALREHIGQIDVLAPQWIQLTSPNGDLAYTRDPQADAIVQAAKNHPSVIPAVFNAMDAVWNGPEADHVIMTPAAADRMIANLREAAKKGNWTGIMFDFENMSPQGVASYPAFLARARAALAQDKRQVWVTAPFDDADWPLKKLQQNVDQLVLMAYDEHWSTGGAGAPAGQGWFEQHLADASRVLDPNKTILALGSYGYDWVRGGESSALTFHEATLTAHDSGANIDFDPSSLNPTYSYKGDDGKDHDVWFLDAVTLFNQIQVSDDWKPKGYGLWRLGSEDPGVWKILGSPYGAASADTLSTIPPGDDVDFDGSGEVLRVTATPQPGKRTIDLDPESELVSDEVYSVVPTAYVVQRVGFHPGKVALTFDDGPDYRWTAKILDILKRENVHATFFVIGENMEKWPELVSRELKEGHDVGSHTFTHPNIGAVPQAEAVLELNATQRLFETITGRSLRLFRPPYFGDAEPSTPEEVRPLLTAQRLGYITVGLRIDPDDWKKPRADLIVSNVMNRLQHPGDRIGQVVLLHDSGGDRRQTIAALPRLIETLKANGYQLVTISQLAGMTPEQAMPPTQRGSLELAVDRFAFFWIRHFDNALVILFMSAIVLGVARLIFLASLSLWHRFRTLRHTPAPLDPDQSDLMISVLIPCFNEEKVIVGSVARVLASSWRNLEVLVIDDGSGDRTSEVVQAAYGADSRVQLIRLENGGKARALNHGLTRIKGEVVIALDADTLFPPQTLGLLARWFADPKIGAVAGNALVGNRVNLITRWQALEYVTAQNLERRALAALGAVTVVPGAVGAWRRSALEAMGGYPADTLAEDQDLTLAIQQAGWTVSFDPEAVAFTESPDRVSGLLKQRFRWSFGTLQCLWKHRAGLFNRANPVLGFVALPQVWLFQIVLTLIAPLVDLAMVWSLISAWMASHSHPTEWSSDDLVRAVAAWSTFILLDLAAGVLGMAMERRAPWADLPWLPLQRFGYRQMMYYVVIKAMRRAMDGRVVGWGKLERRASVAMRT